MSENLNEMFTVSFDDATVITVPIDTTLSNSGEAADAAAVGAALALKADASSVVAISVNGESADAQGKILISGLNIPMSTVDTTDLKSAITAAGSRTGTDIPVSSEAGAATIAQAISDAGGKTANDIPMTSAEGSPSIGAKITAMDTVAGANSTAIEALQARAGDSIPLESGGTEMIAEAIADRVKTVNGDGPDSDGNVNVTHALSADNLTSSQSQSSIGAFTRRTSGGAASISDGPAWMSTIRGERVHVGYVPESLDMTVTTAPREEGETPITATIDHDTFVAYVEDASGTYTMTYTTSWSTSPSLYGVTVTGDPVSGDQITITFTAEDRGTIIQSDPQSFVSTGYNLYNHELGYCIGLKYSNTYGFRIAGTYTAVKYASTITGTKQTILPVDGAFDIPANGYIFVEGGNDTDTEVYMTWADWALGRTGVNWEEYTENEIDLSTIMSNVFPYGLLRVGDVRDEIDFNTGTATSNVSRLAYSEENLATAKASGRAWEADTDYIYLEKASPESTAITLEGDYTASDHGLEYFVGTDCAVYAIIIYGNSLKNKLERDVLTISQQTLSTSEKAQVQSNIGAASAAAVTALSDQMATKVPYIDLGNLTNGTSRSFTVANGSRIILFTIGTGGTKSMFLIAATSTGTVSNLEIGKDSYITLSTSQNTVTIANSGSTTPRVWVFVFDGSISSAS